MMYRFPLLGAELLAEGNGTLMFENRFRKKINFKPSHTNNFLLQFEIEPSNS